MDLSTTDAVPAPDDIIMGDTIEAGANDSNNSDSEGDSAGNDNIIIPEVPSGSLKSWLIYHGTKAITGYAQKSKRASGIPESSKEIDGYLERIKLFLNFLEYGNFQISPTYKDTAGLQLHKSLEIVFNRSKYPQFHFPESYETRAEALFNRFEALNWGATTPANTGPTGHAVAQPSSSSSPIKRNLTRPQTITRALYPPEDHPIWGRRGILHGLTPVEGSARRRRGMILDSRYEQRRANIHGANGLSLGQWFPSQHAALFRGAHGHPQAGIYGTADSGAYSVVVAAKYTDTDEDRGDTIFYSGPGSEDNKQPHKLPEGNTAPLEKSIRSGQPVRVLRSGGYTSRRTPASERTYAPSVGIRYDGLYRVVGKKEKHNPHGGLYLVFELRRNPGQESLDVIQRRSPTEKEKRDYAQRWNLDW